MLNASRDRIITSDRSSCIAVSPYCGTASISAVQASTENHQGRRGERPACASKSMENVGTAHARYLASCGR